MFRNMFLINLYFSKSFQKMFTFRKILTLFIEVIDLILCLKSIYLKKYHYYYYYNYFLLARNFFTYSQTRAFLLVPGNSNYRDLNAGI